MSRPLARARASLLASVATALLIAPSAPLPANAQTAAAQRGTRAGELPTVTVRTPVRTAPRRAARTPRVRRATAPGSPPPASVEPAREAALAEKDPPTGVANPYQTPASVSTIGTSEIATSGGDVREALRDVPGTFTRINPQNPGVAVNIRGMEGSGRVNMMIDGVRQNFRFTGHEAQGFTYVDPALLAGVDIQRGAISAGGGAGALAGSANFRTIGIDDIIKPGRLWGAIGNLNWGSNGVGLSEMFAGAARINPNVAIGGAISHRNSSDYRNGNGVIVPGTGQDLISGLLKGDFIVADHAKLQLGAVFYNNDFFANSYWQTILNNTYTAKFSYAPPRNPLIDFRFNVAYNDLTMTYDLARNSTGSARGRVIHDRGWGIDTANTSRFFLGPVHVKTTYGAEFFRDVVKSVNSAAVPSFGVNPSGTSEIGGVFSQTTFSYGRLDLIAGLRYDFLHVDGAGAVSAANPLGMPPGPYTVNRNEGRFNPKVTLAYQVTNWLQPYVSYGETFRPPTISELLTGGVHPGTGGMSFFPNPFLRPEISRGFELGTNIRADAVWFAHDAFRMKVNYFHHNVEDYVTACFPPAGPGVYFCNNPGTSLVQGVELQVDYEVGFAFAKINYTYAHSDLPSQVNGFGAYSFLPEHVFAATLGGRFLDRRLTIGGRISIVGSTNQGEINVLPGQAVFLPSYELVDLFASYKFEGGLELGVNVTNLFDKAYTGALTTSAAGPVLNGRGRTVFLNARAHF